MSEMSVNYQFYNNQFQDRENNTRHITYDKEFLFYNAVKEGNLEKVKEFMVPLQSEGLGKLSDNPVRNMKYHLIITIALISRFCIEGGMLPEEAYSLSDIYIQKLDKLGAEWSVKELHETVILDYVTRMQKIKCSKSYSKQTYLVIDYIYDHLHEKIDLNTLAEISGMNKSYLCELFKKETGTTIGDYIMNMKIDSAKNMLMYSDYTFMDIATTLGFSSHSHFISCFKKITSYTPKQYKDEFFRKQLSEER